MPHRTQRPPRRDERRIVARPQFREVRGKSGRLWCRYDPQTKQLEFVMRLNKHSTLTEVVDLSQYEAVEGDK